jgi:hypothetical protein
VATRSFPVAFKGVRQLPKQLKIIAKSGPRVREYVTDYVNQGDGIYREFSNAII